MGVFVGVGVCVLVFVGVGVGVEVDVDVGVFLGVCVGSIYLKDLSSIQHKSLTE